MAKSNGAGATTLAVVQPLAAPGGGRGRQRSRSIVAQLAPVDAKPPAHLSEEAAGEWKRLGAELAREGRLTAVDRNLFAAYCTVFARWIAAEQQVRELGLVVKSPSGVPVTNPYLEIANKALDRLIRMGKELGLSPAARGELKG